MLYMKYNWDVSHVTSTGLAKNFINSVTDWPYQQINNYLHDLYLFTISYVDF